MESVSGTFALHVDTGWGLAETENHGASGESRRQPHGAGLRGEGVCVTERRVRGDLAAARSCGHPRAQTSGSGSNLNVTCIEHYCTW